MNMRRFIPFAAPALPVLLAGCWLPALLTTGINLTESSDGNAIITNVGTQITVTLASNATTGYRWEHTELDTLVVENTGQTYVPPASTDLVGAGGSERWEFTARAAGTTTLTLEYRRPNEPEGTEAENTFLVNVTVQ